MLRKSTMLALTAFAVLGLAVSNASAFPGKPGGPGGIKGPGMGNPGIVKPAGGIKIIPSNPKGPYKPWPTFNPHPKPKWPIIVRPRPIWYPAPVVVSRPVVIGGPTYVAARPTPGPCTCLSKEYTQEGAVLFKDNCTKEMAMNPPLQQTGAVDPQQQTAQYAR